jgi:hypothetical protein
MRRIRGQIEKEETSFSPDRPQLPYFMIAVDGGIVKYCKCVFRQIKRECIKKTDKLIRGDTIRRGETIIWFLRSIIPEMLSLAVLWEGTHTCSPGNSQPQETYPPVQTWLLSA